MSASFPTSFAPPRPEAFVPDHSKLVETGEFDARRDGPKITHPIIQLRNLTFKWTRNANLAVKGVTFDIDEAKVTAIIGPSGCGKSSLLWCLVRLPEGGGHSQGLFSKAWHSWQKTSPYSPYGGEIWFRGTNILDPQMFDVSCFGELRNRIGFVFQKSAPFPKSIFNNIAYGLTLDPSKKLSRSEISDRVESTLKKVHLWDEINGDTRRHAYQLSGGQQQRLCIARTLVVSPDVLLMDEPCSALDPISVAKIEDLISELKASKTTVVIVTHNMEQARRVSDSTLFMYEGRLIEYGTSADIFTKPKTKHTEQYIRGVFG